MHQDCADISAMLKACLAGDVVARAEFLVHYSPLIENTVAFRLAAMSHPRPPVRGDIEDIRNDILERLLRDNCAILKKLEHAEKINGWLHTLTRNHVVDYVRKHSARMRALELKPELETPSDAKTPEESAIDNERAEILAEHLAALPHRERLLLEMYYTHGLKYAEISEITHQNINTVAAQLHRVKAKLRTHLEPIQNAI